MPSIDTVFNLDVEDDESFLAEGIICHNCRSTMTAVMSPDGVVGNRPQITDTRTREKREVDFRKEARQTGRSIKDIRSEWARERVGRVPAKTTYEEFLRRSPKGFQREVLGTTKSKLFREGKLTLDKFVDRSGHEYTLPELRARHSKVFEELGLET